MSRNRKIVFIGAASLSFGLAMLRDVFANRELSGCTLCLVDRDRRGLARMTELAALLNGASGAGLTIESSDELLPSLDGAGFVVNATAIDRLRMWKLDFEVPRKYGIRHTLGENGGPGGLFFTLRTLPLVFDIVRAMEDRCPDALFLNFSNPESRIILALGRYSRIRAMGLCHGIFMAQADVARIMGLPAETVDVWGAGLNHFQWLAHIRDRASGGDLYPLLRERERTYDASFAPLTRRLFRTFGLWPTCSDDHLGEYLAYGWEAGESGYDFAGDMRYREELQGRIDAVLGGTSPLPPDWLTPSGERGAAVIGAVLGNRHRFIESGIVYNQGAIPNLPADAAVEVPVVADGAGIHPVSLGPLPDAIAKLLATQVTVQQLAVDAAVHASKELALQALLVDPVINSADAAVRLLDELWEANRPYIRNCLGA
jgi:alpha-galactosidase